MIHPLYSRKKSTVSRNSQGRCVPRQQIEDALRCITQMLTDLPDAPALPTARRWSATRYKTDTRVATWHCIGQGGNGRRCKSGLLCFPYLGIFGHGTGV
jgi:hypothetical protein